MDVAEKMRIDLAAEETARQIIKDPPEINAARGWNFAGEVQKAAFLASRRSDKGDKLEKDSTLPTVRVRPSGRAIIDRLRSGPADSLEDLYDPDRESRKFYKPMEEYAHIYYAPIRTKDGRYAEAASPHRIQLVEKAEENGKTVYKLREVRPPNGRALAHLAETQEYKRSRFFESTGSWIPYVSEADYRKWVFPIDPRASMARLRESNRLAREEVLDTRDKRRENHEQAVKKLREYGDDSFYFGGSGELGPTNQSMADIDTEFIPLSGGSYNRQLFLYAHWEQTAKAFYEKNHSEPAKNIINVTTDFTLGRGVASKIKNRFAREIWDEFWTRNNMDERLGVLCSDSTWQGELLINKDEFLKGYIKIRSIDPGAFTEIVTLVEDVEQVLFYAQQSPTPYQMNTSQFHGRNVNVPLMKYVIKQYPATEMMHIKLNVSSSEKWGRSDFYSCFGSLKRHRDWTNAATLRDMLQANLVWKIKVHGDDADVNAFVEDPANMRLPANGGTWVENDALELSGIHTDIVSSTNTGSTGEFLLSLIAMNVQFPLQYFSVSGGGTTRANSLTQAEPFGRRISTRQQVIKRMLDRLYVEVMRKATDAGRITVMQLRFENAEPEWIFPATYEEDRGAMFRDLSTAKGEATISHRTMATKMAQELHLDEYDYDEEIAEIRKEENDPVLKLLPPFAQPKGPSGGPPGAPGGGVPGSPADNPGPQASLSPREQLSGTDERAKFKAQQKGSQIGTGAPPVRESRNRLILSNTDFQFLNRLVERGFAGEVRLPSGAVANIPVGMKLIREANPYHEPSRGEERGVDSGSSTGDRGTLREGDVLPFFARCDRDEGGHCLPESTDYPAGATNDDKDEIDAARSAKLTVPLADREKLARYINRAVSTTTAPKLSANSSRQDLIGFLKWNDPDGAYSDYSTHTEGIPTLTHNRAWELVRDVYDQNIKPAEPGKVMAFKKKQEAEREQWRQRLRESNPNHAPAGTPEGGQFISGDGENYPLNPYEKAAIKKVPDALKHSPAGILVVNADGTMKIEPSGPEAAAAIKDLKSRFGLDVNTISANQQRIADLADSPEFNAYVNKLVDIDVLPQSMGGVWTFDRAVKEFGDWYPQNGKIISDFAKDIDIEPSTAIAFTSAMSPQMYWPDNLANAQVFMRALKDGRASNLPELLNALREETGKGFAGYPANLAKGLAIFKGASINDNISQQFKVRSFFNNLMFPHDVTLNSVANDIHHMRVNTGDMKLSSGNDLKLLDALIGTAAKYDTFVKATQGTAQKLLGKDHPAHAIQAVLWEILRMGHMGEGGKSKLGGNSEHDRPKHVQKFYKSLEKEAKEKAKKK